MSKDLIRAADLRGTMSGPGWRVINAIAEEILKGRERDAIACDEDDKAIRLLRRAGGARDFWNELLRHAQSAASVTATDVDPIAM